MTKKDLLVIGVGLPRTGTLTLMNALEMILPGECLHGLKAIRHEQEWCDIFNDKMSDDEFKTFLSSSYVAAVDAPFCFVYERALKLFPRAKVILSVRDPEGWVNSMDNTVMNLVVYSPMIFLTPFFPDYLTSYGDDGSLNFWSLKLFQGVALKSVRNQEMINFLKQGRGVEYFNKWIDEVESTVPEERLLKFNVKEGWGPLCKHLNVPHPDVPFPNVNNSMNFMSYLNRNIRRSWLLLYEFISIPLLVYGLYKLSH